MAKHRARVNTKSAVIRPQSARFRCYGIQVCKLDNPGAGSQFFLADEGRALVPTQAAATGMSQADAKSLLQSTPFHKLLLTLDGVLESQVMKLW